MAKIDLMEINSLMVYLYTLPSLVSSNPNISSFFDINFVGIVVVFFIQTLNYYFIPDFQKYLIFSFRSSLSQLTIIQQPIYADLQYNILICKFKFYMNAISYPYYLYYINLYSHQHPYSKCSQYLFFQASMSFLDSVLYAGLHPSTDNLFPSSHCYKILFSFPSPHSLIHEIEHLSYENYFHRRIIVDFQLCYFHATKYSFCSVTTVFYQFAWIYLSLPPCRLDKLKEFSLT